MVQSFTDDFQVTWANPSDAQVAWIHDPMHFPDPLPALAGEVLVGVYEGFMNARTTFVNGYAFSTPPSPRPPTPEIMRRGIMDVWTNDFQPKIEENARAIRGADYERMSLAELGEAIGSIVARSVRAFGYTMEAITGFMGPTFGLVEVMERELGADGPRLAAMLLQGSQNGTAAAGDGLSVLAEAATARPAVADALSAGRFGGLREVEGGPEFLEQLDGYLDRFGWRAESWGLMHLPTAAEQPEQVLSMVARYLTVPGNGPREAIQRSAAQRAEVLDQIERRLLPEALTQVRALIEASKAHVPVSEGRALWQLTTVGSLRVPVLALGRKLVAAGALDAPDDAFYLSSSELREAALDPSAAVAATAQQRRIESARFATLTPPPFIGARLDMATLPPEMVALVRLFSGAARPQVQGQEIKGQAASPGVVRGRARVIHHLSEAAKLERGEILVCAMTAPPWTPLFAIAAGVVTNTGGVLSHSAICAREYAIPCVVGTQVATHLIPDGAMISVDGSTGIVRIEG